MAFSNNYDRYLQKIINFVRNDNYEAADSILNNQTFSISFSLVYPNMKLLHYFVIMREAKVVEYLLSRGHSVNDRDAAGRTPLMIAAKKVMIPTVENLFAAGGDIFMVNNDNRSALHYLFEEHVFCIKLAKLFYPELRKKFLTDEKIAQHLIDVNCHLYQACYFENSNIIEYMLEQKLPVDSAHPITSCSALHIAITIEHVDIVKLLLKYGANVNVLDCNGSQPLRYIYLSRRSPEHTQEKVELLKILLKHGASPTAFTFFGSFQIVPTLSSGSREAISVVLQSNMDFTAKDRHGCYVLHYIVANQGPGVAEELKLHIDRCDVNAADNSGITPLHSAVKYMNVNMVQLLLEQGARSNCQGNHHGYTPLYYAFRRFEKNLENQFRQIVELLLYHDADPQLMVSEETNVPITIFSVAERRNILNLTEPLVAQLVILEEIGTPITEIIHEKISSHPTLNKYFNRYQKFIRKNVSGSVTFIKLLNGNRKSISQYSGNKKLMLKLIRLSYKPKLNGCYSHYCNILRKNFSKGIQYRYISDKAAVVICNIFRNTINKSDLIVNKIIDYLDDESLQALYQFGKDISL